MLEPLKNMDDLLPLPAKKNVMLTGDSSSTLREMYSAGELSSNNTNKDQHSPHDAGMELMNISPMSVPESDRDASMASSAISASDQTARSTISFGRDATADSAVTMENNVRISAISFGRDTTADMLRGVRVEIDDDETL